jgi:hypothetical protein
MPASPVKRVFVLVADKTPILAFEAKNLQEARGLRNEQWLHDDLKQLKSYAAPLWDGIAKLSVLIATEAERHRFAAEAGAANAAEDELTLVFLVELDTPAEKLK